VPACSVSPVESVADALDRWRAGERAEVMGTDFLDVLASVPDPRDRRGVRYSAMALLAMAVLATAAGMRGYAGFATGARTAPEEVLARLGVRYRRPSEKTFRSLLSRLDAADLDRRLGAYFTAVAAARAAGEVGLLAVALTARRCAARGAAGDGQRTWWRCSPTVPGWSSDSSPSLTRATKSPACECFSSCSRGCGW
jgi:hypothetical protein